MQTILTVFQVFLSLGLIGLVLIQHGRGADAGAAFGSGASATVFGASGSGSFLTRLTAVFGALFYLTAMALAFYAAQGGKPAGLMDSVGDSIVIEAPAPQQPPPQQGSSDVPAVPGAATVPIDQGSAVPMVPSAAPTPAASDVPAAIVAPEAASPDATATPAEPVATPPQAPAAEGAKPE